MAENIKALFIGGECDGCLKTISRRVASIDVTSASKGRKIEPLHIDLGTVLELERWVECDLVETYHYTCNIGPFNLYVLEGHQVDPLEALVEQYTLKQAI